MLEDVIRKFEHVAGVKILQLLYNVSQLLPSELIILVGGVLNKMQGFHQGEGHRDVFRPGQGRVLAHQLLPQPRHRRGHPALIANRTSDT